MVPTAIPAQSEGHAREIHGDPGGVTLSTHWRLQPLHTDGVLYLLVALDCRAIGSRVKAGSGNPVTQVTVA